MSDFQRTGFRLWGYFDEPGQTEPTYEPPHDAPCPYCLAPVLADDIRTHCIMFQSPSYAKRSYFYRTHRTCDDAALQRGETPGTVQSMDDKILDAIAKAGD